MIFPSDTLLLLFAILGIGLIVPDLFRKFKMPYVISLILIGAILGPHAIGYIRLDPVIEFFGFLGSAFLMLMAGLEVKQENLKKLGSKIFIMAAGNGLFPFLTGLFIVRYFGYSWTTALLVATIFISSSVAIIIGLLRDTRLINTKIGQSIASATILEDVTSLLLLAIILQKTAPIVQLSIPAYVMALFGALALFKYVVPLIADWFGRHVVAYGEEEDQLRLVVVLLLAALLFFSIMGVHALIAAFIVGIFLSHFVTSEKLTRKIHTLGYGLFIPVFFVVVGTELDFSIFASFDYSNLLIFSIVLGLVVAKIVSGYFSARLARFDNRKAMLFGVASIPQLTTTLAVTYAAAELGLIDDVLTTAILVLSIVTTLLSPFLLRFVFKPK